MLHIHEVLEIHMDGLLVREDLLFRQIDGLTQCPGVQDSPGAELEGFQTLVRIGNVFAHEHHTVVFHDDSLVLRILREFLGDLLAQQFAARKGIRGEADRTAHAAGLRDDAGVGHLVHDAEGHQSRGMRVDDAPELRTHLVQGAVKRIFGRRTMRADDGSVGLDTHDVGRGQGALVDAGRGDPHVPVVVHDGEVSAGSGRHLPAIDAADDQGDLLGRVHEFGIDFFHSLSA